MTNEQGKIKFTKSRRKKVGLKSCLIPLAFSVCASTGCAGTPRFWPTTPPPPGPVESVVLRGDDLEPERIPSDGSASADLAGARELYRRGDYTAACKHFHRIAENTKNTPQIAEEARFYEAECLRQIGKYPKAADTYVRLLNDFPAGVHRDQSVRRIFDICQIWLKDTDAEIQAVREKKQGKRWFVWQGPVVHFDKTKPIFDEEGRALEGLEQVKLHDINGPMADRALFLAGSVKFFREEYKESDYYFTQITEMHPNSQLAPKAVELAIISKHMSTGGSDYDGRKVAEARQLVQKALDSYPELASQEEKRKFLDRQMYGITYQQAEKDFKIAEFYRRTGHAGSAYFYYEIVRRRYPGTSFFDKATERMLELRAKLDKEQRRGVKKEQSAPQESPGRPELAPAPKQVPAELSPPEPELAPPPRPVTN